MATPINFNFEGNLASALAILASAEARGDTVSVSSITQMIIE